MDFEWVAIALGDVVWISVAFALGYLARLIGLPPLIGFLATGFLLSAQGAVSGQMLDKLADLGITLLLFTIGLKLDLRTLARPQVLAVTLLHMATVVIAVGLGLYGLAVAGAPSLSALDMPKAALLAFAMSFSSTVYVAKVLEERGEMSSLHGRIAIGVLIVQDLAAVAFLAASTGKWPSPFAILVIGLLPLRPVLKRLLENVGHGELLVLYGLLLALGGAELFELLGLKGDLGALVAGVLIAGHVKAQELAKTMLGFKDLFLLGFFLSIGQAGEPDWHTLTAALLLTPLIFLKSALFFGLFSAFRLRARTALLASLNLTNFSEFGLIVAAIGVGNGWIPGDYLVVLAIAVAFSMAVAAVLGSRSNRLYARHRARWQRLQRSRTISEDDVIDLGGARIAVIGMGRVGTGAYDAMTEQHPGSVVGVDIDPSVVTRHSGLERKVIHGDPSDADFWDRIHAAETLDVVMIALPRASTSLAVVRQLRDAGYEGEIAATARYADQEAVLLEAGANTVFNTYSNAGAGFAAHILASNAD